MRCWVSAAASKARTRAAVERRVKAATVPAAVAAGAAVLLLAEGDEGSMTLTAVR